MRRRETFREREAKEIDSIGGGFGVGVGVGFRESKRREPFRVPT